MRLVTRSDFDGLACGVLLKEAGIIDPTSVAKSAITSAVSIASIFLTTECAIVKEEENKPFKEDELI